MNAFTNHYSTIMEALGWTLLNSVWQACLLFLITSIILRLMPTQLSRSRYAVACGALAMMVLVNIATYFVVLESTSSETTSVAAHTMAIDAENFSHPLSDEFTFWQSAFQFLDANMTFILLGWSIGALLFSLRIVSGWFFLSSVRRDAIDIQDDWYEKLQHLAKKFGLSKAIRLAETSRIQVPMVIGFLKPIILVPTAMLLGLSPAQIETVFVHELAHIRRNDYIINLFQTFLESIFFFNPFVWLLSGIIRREREYCCDDEVINRHGEVLVYAQALASLEEIRLQRTSLALSLAENKNLLFNRIRRIMEKSAKNSFGRERMIPALLLVIGMVCASWLTIRTDNREQYVASNEDPQIATSDFVKQDTIIKDKKSSSKTTIIRIDEDGNSHEQVFEESDNLGDFDFTFEPIALDAIMDFPMPPVAIDAPNFPMAPGVFSSPDVFPSFQFDTIPGRLYYRSHNDENWKEFSREFEKKFREEFGDFYKKNEKEFDKMMKEMEANFEKRFEEEELAQQYLREAIPAPRELMNAEEHAYRERVEAMQVMKELQELDVVGRQVEVEAMAEAKRAVAKAVHEVSANLEELSAERHEADGNKKAFERNFRALLIEDGYITSTDEIKSFKREQNGNIEVNGKKIKDIHLPKYNNLYKKYFKPGFHYWNAE
jgi:bla regulator protein blaR1